MSGMLSINISLGLIPGSFFIMINRKKALIKIIYKH